MQWRSDGATLRLVSSLASHNQTRECRRSLNSSASCDWSMTGHWWGERGDRRIVTTPLQYTLYLLLYLSTVLVSHFFFLPTFIPKNLFCDHQRTAINDRHDLFTWWGWKIIHKGHSCTWIAKRVLHHPHSRPLLLCFHLMAIPRLKQRWFSLMIL